MQFDLSAQQAAAKKEATEVAGTYFSELSPEEDASSHFNKAGWIALSQSDFLRGFIPTEYGGRGWDTLTKAVALEAFGYKCADNGLALGFSSLVCTILPPLFTFGSEDQIARYLPKIIRGELMTADCITEPQAGSDAMAMETTAEANDSGFILNGEKVYIGLAPIADLLLVYAKTDPDAGAWGLSAFLVDCPSDGIHKSDNREKLGLRTLPMGDVRFDRCQVPAEARLGGEGSGLSLFNESMEWERALILATQVGVLARQLETCVHFTQSRKQFKKPIAQFQSVSNRIAEMRVRLETCKLHLYKTSWLIDQGKSIAAEAAMTKLCISEAFLASSMDAMRIHGAAGYMSGSQTERDLRDSVGGVLYAGTSDIQRNLIARLSGA
ncbi:acyl-CoA dehydrogenase family protein [Pelagicoccus sp. SDUM812002]|uniref:acyl-CoA dehydrogenase family protein n=1 Tax=Pelagicoccus sp. SDUM812002 TaxID=3041266 RepID=UPI00280E7667|nr:acyl-CoA dehydrogenase family protein [Pelagicoccus sp. SDUM812002]MDQ8185698.1 acyl-CoA dehydrogenase family protein [Pelagicoccus sp. SDUM812002]